MKKQQRTKKKKIIQKAGGSTKKTQHENFSGQNNKKSELQKNMEKSLLVGSQKRKARKQSITRNTLTFDTSTANADEGSSKGIVFFFIIKTVKKKFKQNLKTFYILF